MSRLIMLELDFKVLTARQSTPQEWLRCWSQWYDDEAGEQDRSEYARLIGLKGTFTADDFRAIGKWKDSAWAEAKYKPNVASVAFPIWEQAAEEPPQCPPDDGVQSFLDGWARRRYTEMYRSGISRNKQFGLSRASTLLHFLSAGRFPIYDSRVRTAIARLSGGVLLADSVDAYVTICLPFIDQLRTCCESDDIRKLDKALFCYGAIGDRYLRRM